MENDSLGSDSGWIRQQLASIRISAMNFLAAREHSISELRGKLRNKLRRQCERKNTSNDEQQFNELFEELIEKVIQQLIAENLLNEARFTESFIRFRIDRGHGPVKICHELNERGISNELINDSLETSYSFWQQHIKAVRNKRFGDKIPKDYKEQTKQSRFLYQRGFSSELIRSFFNDF